MAKTILGDIMEIGPHTDVADELDFDDILIAGQSQDRTRESRSSGWRRLYRATRLLKYSCDDKGRSVLPVNVAAYLILAFERALAAPEKKRPTVLAESLGLTLPKGRPRKHPQDEIVQKVLKLRGDGASLESVCETVASTMGLSPEAVRYAWRNRAERFRG